MDIRRLELTDNQLRAVYNLRLQIEIAEHRNFRQTTSVEDLAELITIASASQHPLVKSAYAKFTHLLDVGRLQQYMASGLPVKESLAAEFVRGNKSS